MRNLELELPEGRGDPTNRQRETEKGEGTARERREKDRNAYGRFLGIG